MTFSGQRNISGISVKLALVGIRTFTSFLQIYPSKMKLKQFVNLIIYTCIRFVINESGHEISNNVLCVASKGSDQPAHTRSLIRVFASHLNII